MLGHIGKINFQNVLPSLVAMHSAGQEPNAGGWLTWTESVNMFRIGEDFVSGATVPSTVTEEPVRKWNSPKYFTKRYKGKGSG